MSRLPPLRGEPPPPRSERPCCLACGIALQPRVETIWQTVEHKSLDGRHAGHGYEATAREWTGRYHGDGIFCSGKCAILFAQLIAQRFLEGQEVVGLSAIARERLPKLRASIVRKRLHRAARDVVTS